MKAGLEIHKYMHIQDTRIGHKAHSMHSSTLALHLRQRSMREHCCCNVPSQLICRQKLGVARGGQRNRSAGRDPSSKQSASERQRSVQRKGRAIPLNRPANGATAKGIPPDSAQIRLLPTRRVRALTSVRLHPQPLPSVRLVASALSSPAPLTRSARSAIRSRTRLQPLALQHLGLGCNVPDSRTRLPSTSYLGLGCLVRVSRTRLPSTSISD